MPVTSTGCVTFGAQTCRIVIWSQIYGEKDILSNKFIWGYRKKIIMTIIISAHQARAATGWCVSRSLHTSASPSRSSLEVIIIIILLTWVKVIIIVIILIWPGWKSTSAPYLSSLEVIIIITTIEPGWKLASSWSAQLSLGVSNHHHHYLSWAWV